MHGVRESENVIGYPIIYSHRIHYILSVCLEPDVKGMPSCCKFSFPCQFSFSFANISFAFEPTAFNFMLANRASRTSIHYLHFIRKILLGICNIQPPTNLTNGKIWDGLYILLLANHLGYFFAQAFTVS